MKGQRGGRIGFRNQAEGGIDAARFGAPGPGAFELHDLQQIGVALNPLPGFRGESIGIQMKVK
ncbi:MAG: hypothetical protein J6W65_05080, partial [Oscillospiraceae bacterium]|nr:hypothetical protein [Oscillospiraceae bacterium]